MSQSKKRVRVTTHSPGQALGAPRRAPRATDSTFWYIETIGERFARLSNEWADTCARAIEAGSPPTTVALLAETSDRFAAEARRAGGGR